jgi:hypothetical protein
LLTPIQYWAKYYELLATCIGFHHFILNKKNVFTSVKVFFVFFSVVTSAFDVEPSSQKAEVASFHLKLTWHQHATLSEHLMMGLTPWS